MRVWSRSNWAFCRLASAVATWACAVTFWVTATSPLRFDRFEIGLRGLQLRLSRIVARDGLVIDRLGAVARVLRPDFILEHLGLHGPVCAWRP